LDPRLGHHASRLDSPDEAQAGQRGGDTNLVEEFMAPMGLTQAALAKAMASRANTSTSCATSAELSQLRPHSSSPACSAIAPTLGSTFSGAVTCGRPCTARANASGSSGRGRSTRPH